MDKARVLEALNMLHAELAGAPQLDAEARAALQQVATEIRETLEADRATENSGEGMLSGRLNEVLLGFEAEHPDLTRAVGRVASALANMGI